MGQCGKLLTLIISLSPPPPPVLQDGVGIQLLLIKSAPRSMVSLISVSSCTRRVLCKRIVTSFCFGQDLNIIEQSMISHTLWGAKRTIFFFKWIKPQHCSKGSLLVSCSSMYSHTSHSALQYTHISLFLPFNGSVCVSASGGVMFSFLFVAYYVVKKWNTKQFTMQFFTQNFYTKRKQFQSLLVSTYPRRPSTYDTYCTFQPLSSTNPDRFW